MRRRNMWGYVWHYTDASASDYALSGVCSPKNYEDSRALEVTFDAVDTIASDYGKRVYPLNPEIIRQKFKTRTKQRLQSLICPSHTQFPKTS